MTHPLEPVALDLIKRVECLKTEIEGAQATLDLVLDTLDKALAALDDLHLSAFASGRRSRSGEAPAPPPGPA